MTKQPKTVKLTPDERKKLSKYREQFTTNRACMEAIGVTDHTYKIIKTIGTCGQSTYQKLTDKIFSL
jgi:hypothetical protein